MKKTSFITYFRTFFRVLEFYLFDYFDKKLVLNNFSKTKLYTKIEKGIVLDGPFKGMIYPKNESFGSAFFPKILGTYERELNPLISNLLKVNYDVVIDVGCAEGYYAVGFAKFGKAKNVFAYDIETKARELCLNMANSNGVTSNLTVSSLFDEKEYQKILNDFPKAKMLIILDIEGFEKVLLNKNFQKIIKNTDFLIEMHDYIDIEVTDSISKFFDSKDIEKIYSISDFQKALEYNSDLLKGLDFKTKFYVLAEGRPEQMKWYFIKG